MSSASERMKGLLELIGQTYDAAQDDRLWPAIATRMAETFNSQSGVLLVQNSAPGPSFNWHNDIWDARAAGEYETYYGSRDVLLQRTIELGIGRVVTSGDLMRDSEFERTEFYNDFFARNGNLFYILGSFSPVSEDQTALAVVHRPRKLGNYGEEERRRCIEFLPHLVRALQIRYRLTQSDIERHAALDAVERNRTAAIVVARNGAIIHANRQAEAMLQAGDALRSVAGQLAALGKPQTERLAALIRSAADTATGRGDSSGGTVSLARSGRLPITVLVAPFRPAREGTGLPFPAAILFVRDPEQLSPGSAALQGLFGLTPAEATIAIHLARGRSLADIAARHSLTLNTLRTHLKNILGKTGTSRQAELVAVILRSVAPMDSR